MSRKKINFGAKTKLDNLDDSGEKNNEFNIIKNSVPARPVSFRLREIDLQRINEILKKANELNETNPFNKTSLIRGLIMLGTRSDSKEILEEIRKSI
jgi:hypothetical protein